MYLTSFGVLLLEQCIQLLLPEIDTGWPANAVVSSLSD